jgi:multicomponent Na+:H+ antiporter subunit G
MMNFLDVWGNVTVVVGAMVIASAALGVIRFPDAYTRVSAVGTAGGVGIILIITGGLMLQPSLMSLVQAVIIIVMQLTTSAIGSIAIARAAYLSRTELRRCFFDEVTEPGGTSLCNDVTSR